MGNSFIITNRLTGAVTKVQPRERWSVENGRMAIKIGNGTVKRVQESVGIAYLDYEITTPYGDICLVYETKISKDGKAKIYYIFKTSSLYERAKEAQERKEAEAQVQAQAQTQRDTEAQKRRKEELYQWGLKTFTALSQNLIIDQGVCDNTELLVDSFIQRMEKEIKEFKADKETITQTQKDTEAQAQEITLQFQAVTKMGSMVNASFKIDINCSMADVENLLRESGYIQYRVIGMDKMIKLTGNIEK